jgi:hypothetical protein
LGRGQRKGFKHSEETKRVIAEASKQRFWKEGGLGGFNIKKPCPNCGTEMSAANLTHHLPQCLKYKGRIKQVKAMRIRLRKFGLTVEQFEEMNARQDGRCYLCRKEPSRADCRLITIIRRYKYASCYATSAIWHSDWPKNRQTC